MNCPSCQHRMESVADMCPLCGWSFAMQLPSQGQSLVRPAERPKLQCEVELAITIDRTGSSQTFQTGIAKTCGIILKQGAVKARSMRCWVASHGDLDKGQAFIIHTDGGTPEQALADVEGIVYGGGGEPPEHHLDAVESLLNSVPWTADASRARGAIIAFTTSDTKPARSGITAAELGAAIRERGILFYLVSEITPTLLELATAAEGLVFRIRNDPDPVELQRIAAQVAASIVATVASGGTVPMTVTPPPSLDQQ